MPTTNEPCFDFCRHFRNLLNKTTPAHLSDLKRKTDVCLGDVVLFKLGEVWHGGIIWSTGLTFIHVVYTSEKTWIVKKDSLTREPWKLAIEGYYDV